MEKSKPEKKFVSGAIVATIWKNPAKNGGSFRTVQLQRRYTDTQGRWQSTDSLRPNDLPKATLLLNKVFEFVSLETENVSEAS